MFTSVELKICQVELRGEELGAGGKESQNEYVLLMSFIDHCEAYRPLV